MVDGALFQDEVNARNISSVPAVYAGDTLVHIGKASLGDLLAALEEKIGAEPVSAEPIRRSYDLHRRRWRSLRYRFGYLLCS